MKNLSFNMALSGILGAVCIVLMFMVALLPIFIYVLPMVCGLILYTVYYECGVKYAMSCYVSVSVLSLLLCPDKESGLLFLAFFGYYPILKIYIDKLKLRLLKLIIKLAIFNTAIVAAYWVLIKLFKIVSISDFTGDAAEAVIWLFLIAANVVLIIYDFALKNMALVYQYRIRKIFFRRK